MTLLELARTGDLPALREKLEEVVRRFGGHGRETMNESDKLLDEALTYARLGDLDEATHRLRLRAEPKFYSDAVCKSEYRSVMAAKRRREAAE